MSDTMKAAWMLVAGFIASVYAAFVSMCMWNWFATRALHVPEISFFGTLGLLWLVRLLTSSNSDERYEWAMFREVVEAAVSDEKREAVER